MNIVKSLFTGAATLALAVGSAYAADDKKDPGFNALDKNNDGYVTRAEATGDKSLVEKFKQADKNNDGKLNRAEYLAVKGKEDVNTAVDKVTDKVNKEKAEARAENRSNASTGATARQPDPAKNQSNR